MSSIEPQLSKELEERLDELPALPAAVTRLMCIDPDHHSYFQEIASTVEAEPSFSARIMAVANSAASGSRVPITTLRTALARIGGKGATSIVVALSVTRVFVPSNAWEKGLWLHALQVAIAARDLARRALDPEINRDEAYLCGLLHDVGRFVVLHEIPEALRHADEGSWGNPHEILEQERSVCGLDHAALGALACTRWGLPDAIVQVVAKHHGPPDLNPVGRLAKMCSLIQVADIAMFPSVLLQTSGFQDADDDVLRDQVQRYLPAFVRLDLANLRELIRSATEEAAATAKTLGL